VYPKRAESPAFTSDSSPVLPLVRKTDTLSPDRKSHEFVKTLMLSNKPNPTSSFNGMNLNNARLLHHFMTVTSKTLFPPQSGAACAAACEIPRLTLEHDFMMHCILGIASVHLHRLQPESPEMQALAAAHRVNALSGLRKAISQPSKRNFKAILATSLSILILASDRSSANPG
jgi:hypothetical protein